MQDTGQANLNPPSVDEIKAFFGLCIAANDFVVTPYLIVDFLSRMKQNGCFHTPGFRTVFTRERFEEIRRFIHFSDPYDVVPDRYDLTVIPYTRLVLLLIIYRRNLKVYGLHNHRFLLTKPWYLLKADSESNSLFLKLNEPVRFGIKPRVRYWLLL